MTELPELVEVAKDGIKKPDCLLTVGSGWKNLGKYNTGKS